MQLHLWDRILRFSADLDAIFNMTERPFKGGIYVEDTKKLVLPDVPGFGFIGFDNE